MNDRLTIASLFPYGPVVRILAFHIGGVGSIPGVWHGSVMINMKIVD